MKDNCACACEHTLLLLIYSVVMSGKSLTSSTPPNATPGNFRGLAAQRTACVWLENQILLR
eukprot:scaffold144249_cov26-Cyclotella_meneghiniana.AAC.2